jgi:membrane protein DedA with SNARE-associated domain
MSDLLLSYGYVVVFLGTIFEGDATLLGASFLAHRHVFSFAGVILTAILATTMFNELVFFVSRKGSKGFIEGRVACHPSYGRVQRWVQKRSVLLMLFSRYIFGFRLAIPVACGAAGMNPLLFTTVNLAGAFLWAVPLGCLGFFLGHAVEAFWHELWKWEWHIACAFIVILTVLLAWKDPELRRVALLAGRIRRFTVWSTHRLRHRFSGGVGVE